MDFERQVIEFPITGVSIPRLVGELETLEINLPAPQPTWVSVPYGRDVKWVLYCPILELPWKDHVKYANFMHDYWSLRLTPEHYVEVIDEICGYDVMTTEYFFDLIKFGKIACHPLDDFSTKKYLSFSRKAYLRTQRNWGKRQRRSEWKKDRLLLECIDEQLIAKARQEIIENSHTFGYEPAKLIHRYQKCRKHRCLKRNECFTCLRCEEHCKGHYKQPTTKELAFHAGCDENQFRMNLDKLRIETKLKAVQEVAEDHLAQEALDWGPLAPEAQVQFFSIKHKIETNGQSGVNLNLKLTDFVSPEMVDTIAASMSKVFGGISWKSILISALCTLQNVFSNLDRPITVLCAITSFVCMLGLAESCMLKVKNFLFWMYRSVFCRNDEAQVQAGAKCDVATEKVELDFSNPDFCDLSSFDLTDLTNVSLGKLLPAVGSCVALLVTVLVLKGDTGRVGFNDLINRFSRMGHVIKSAKDVAALGSEVFDTSADFVMSSVFGRASKDLNSMKNIDAWVQEVVQLNTTELEARMNIDETIQSQVDDLIIRGWNIVRMFDNLNLPFTQRDSVNKCMLFLQRIRETAANCQAGQTRPRVAPSIVHIFGDSGVGKSTCLWALIAKLQASFGITDKNQLRSRTYFRRPCSDFWDGFKTQMTLCVVDDFGAKVDEVAAPCQDFVEAINMCNTAFWQLNMASLSEKQSTYFKCKSVLWTSNKSHFSIKSLTNAEAVLRRVDYKFKQKPKPEFSKPDTQNGRSVNILDDNKVWKYVEDNPERGVLAFLDCIRFDLVDKMDPNDNVLVADLTFTQMSDMVVKQAHSSIAKFEKFNDAVDNVFEHFVKELGKEPKQVPVDNLIPMAEVQSGGRARVPNLAGPSQELYNGGRSHCGLRTYDDETGLPVWKSEERIGGFSYKHISVFESIQRHDLTEFIPLEDTGPGYYDYGLLWKADCVRVKEIHADLFVMAVARAFYQMSKMKMAGADDVGCKNAFDRVFGNYFGMDLEDGNIHICTVHGEAPVRQRLVNRFSNLLGLTDPGVYNEHPAHDDEIDGARRNIFMRAYRATRQKICERYCSYEKFDGWMAVVKVSFGILMAGISGYLFFKFVKWGAGTVPKKSVSFAKADVIIGEADVLEVERQNVLAYSKKSHKPYDFNHSYITGRDRTLFAKTLQNNIADFEKYSADVTKSKGTVQVEKYVADITKGTRVVSVESCGDVVRTLSSDAVPALEAVGVPTAQIQMVVDRNAAEIVTVLHRNMYKLEARQHGKWENVSNMLILKGRLAIVNRHSANIDSHEWRARNVSHQGGVCFDIHKCRKYSVPDDDPIYGKRDVIIIELPRLFEQHRDVTDKFMSSDDFSKFVDLKKISLIGYVPAAEITLRQYFSSDIRSVDSYLSLVDGEKPVQTVRRFFKYGVETTPGDCGAALVCFDKSFNNKIIGIHSGGMSDGIFTAVGTPITVGFLQRLERGLALSNPDSVISMDLAADLDTPVKMTSYESFAEWDLEIPFEGNFTHIGFVQSGIFTPPQTLIQRSPVYGVITTPTMAPAHLSLFRNEDGVLVDPMELARSKAGPAPVPVDEDYLARAVHHLTQSVCMNVLESDRRVLSFSEAITGIEGDEVYAPLNRSSSPGYGWVKSGKGKTKWLGKDSYVVDNIEILARSSEIIALCKSGKRPCTIWADTLKDERRPLAKVAAGKTRLFSVGEMCFTILFRQYFMGFCAHMMRNKISMESCVGVNVYSRDWDRIGHVIQSVGKKVLAGDFTNYDGTLNAEILWKVLDVIESFYNGSELDRVVRRSMWCEIVNSIHITGNFVYMWTHSQPSGCPITTILNCVYHSISARYVYLWCAERNAPVYASLLYYDQFVRHLNYGDDDIWNISDAIISWFNQDTITEAYHTIGMEYTDESKTVGGAPWRTLGEINFLKRGFRFDSSQCRYRAPLSMVTIKEMPMWVRGNIDTWYLTADTLMEAVRELAQYDEITFNSELPNFERAREIVCQKVKCWFDTYSGYQLMEQNQYCV